MPKPLQICVNVVFAGAAVGLTGIAFQLYLFYRKRDEIAKEYTITYRPKVLLEHIHDWRVECSNQIGYTIAQEDVCCVTEKNIWHIQELLEARSLLTTVPTNALSVSFATENFQVGSSCQEFLPKDYKMPAHSYFTYKMLSTRAQATFYNEFGTAYLAGICYYFPPKKQWDFLFINLIIKTVQRLEFLRVCETLILAEPFPKMDSTEETVRRYERSTEQKTYGRYCAGYTRERVLIKVDKEGVAQHAKYNYHSMKFEFTECQACDADHFGNELVYGMWKIFVSLKEEFPSLCNHQ